MLTNPRQTVYGAKRLVGRAFDSPVVQQIKDRFHYEIAAGADGRGGGEAGRPELTRWSRSPPSSSARCGRSRRTSSASRSPGRSSPSPPTTTSTSARPCARRAGSPGFHVERILNEPTAAALAYGYGRHAQPAGPGLRPRRRHLRRLGAGAERQRLRGGLHRRRHLPRRRRLRQPHRRDRCSQLYQEQTGDAFHGDRVAMQRLTDAAERAKCALSERNEVPIQVPFVTMEDNKPFDLDVTLTPRRAGRAGRSSWSTAPSRSAARCCAAKGLDARRTWTR